MVRCLTSSEPSPQRLQFVSHEELGQRPQKLPPGTEIRPERFLRSCRSHAVNAGTTRFDDGGLRQQ